MDYKKIMNKDFNFPKFYDNLIEIRCQKFNIPIELSTKLKEKRDFGLEKYKEYSFQANFENSMTTPSLEHSEEEAIDLLNYILHFDYIISTMGLKNNEVKKRLDETIENILSIIRNIHFFSNYTNLP